MPDQNKSLKFLFEVDANSVNRLKTTIREVTDLMEKLVKTTNGINVGGLGGGNVVAGGGGKTTPTGVGAAMNASRPGQGGPLSGNFSDATKAVKDLGNATRDTMRGMSDAVRRAMDEQKRSVDALNNSLGQLMSNYAGAGKALGGGGGQRMLGSGFASPASAGASTITLAPSQYSIQPVAGQGSTTTALQAAGMPIAGAAAPGAGGGGGGGGGFFAGARNFMGKMPSFPGGALGLVGLAFAGVNAALDEERAGTRAFGTAEARRAGLVTPRIQALRSGDYRFGYAARTLDAESRADVRAQTSGFGANAEQIRGGLGQAAGNVIGGIPGVGMIRNALGIGGGGGDGTILGGFGRVNQQSAMAENAMKQIDARVQSQFMEGLAMQKFQGDLGSRVSAQRLMGIGGFGTQRTRQAANGQNVTEYVDPYADLEYKTTRQGYSPGELAAATAGLRSQTSGQFAGRYGWSAMAAQAEGLGGFADVLGAGARAGGGAQFGFGAVGGGINRAAGVHLGQAIIGSGFDVSGTTSGLGMLNAAQSGMGFTGGIEDWRRVGQVQAGMGVGNAVLGGGLDPYQQGRNLVSAIGIKGGSDVYTQDYLASGMNMRQMMDAIKGGELTETAKQLGLTREDIRAQAGASISSVLEERMPGLDESSPMGRAVKAWKASGQDLPEYLSGLKGRDKRDAVKSLGTAYAIATGQGEEAGIGFTGVVAGMDEETALKLGKVGRKVTGAEADDLQARAEKEKKINDELLRIREKFVETIQGSTDDFSMFAKFGQNMDSQADRFISALGRMTDAIEAKFGKSVIVGPPPEAGAPKKLEATPVAKR